MKLPGIVDALGALYDFVAARRQRISVAMRQGGLPASMRRTTPPPRKLPPLRYMPGKPALVHPPAPRRRRPRPRASWWRWSSSRRWRRRAPVNDVPWKVPQPPWLAAVAAWPRMMARWDVLAAPAHRRRGADRRRPDARGGRGLDPFTGKEPVLDPGAMRGTGLGQLWNGSPLSSIHQREWLEYQRAFRDYLNKGRPRLRNQEGGRRAARRLRRLVDQAAHPPAPAKSALPASPRGRSS